AAALNAAQLLAQEGVSAGVVDARSIKPLDTAMLDSLRDTPLVTVEENTLYGGFGSAVLEYYEQSEQLHRVQVCRAGLHDVFGDLATREEQLRMYGLDADSLAGMAREMLHRRVRTSLAD
ncbi:MAG TPA: transketolase C-terminal domain-containing protein, partial [Candidatus Hydrogenedentes bacterium]|nr:transketolase C-terminal domain-containing protein [Candidatus Hydrogenedentota bacterium]